MHRYTVTGSQSQSEILIGETLANLPRHLPRGPAFIITDTIVSGLYGNLFPDLPVIEIGTGDSIKTFETVTHIVNRLLELGADRTAFIIGIGGGVICDITGFAASIFMRGVPFGFVSTTLLSQVDASVGGKNGVNLAGYKNIMGVFNQPRFVICDLEMLKTLPSSQIRNGLGEVVKHALLSDSDMFDYMETHCQSALTLDHETILRLVLDSVRIKSEIVNQDEKEAGLRRILNLGHTFGHAIEKCTPLNHGEAICPGMMIAARLSARKKWLDRSVVERIGGLLDKLDLPRSFDGDTDQILDALTKDKKKTGQDIHYVFLKGIGQAHVEKISFQQLAEEFKTFAF